ncbi:hypothetical protein ACFYUY_09495 [Kitasatospora sp. NPDC004745]|uniref:hypothetical protein n=1 Tax=Kitasatospora sp. NPDC004745 TaxID=3364019 RepID=UPI003684607F
MPRFNDRPARASGRTGRRAGLAAVALGCTVLVAAGCGSSGSSSPTPSRSFSPDVNSFSGQLPSSVASAKSSLLESASAAASAASAAASAASAAASAASAAASKAMESLSAAASAFESSVSAQVAADRAKAQDVLSKTGGAGNAVSDVTLTGLPKAQAAGFNAALVTVVNSTGSTTSYAVKVEFLDETGKVVDTSYLGIPDVAAGAKATRTAFSPIDRDKALVAKVTQAQRY